MWQWFNTGTGLSWLALVFSIMTAAGEVYGRTVFEDGFEVWEKTAGGAAAVWVTDPRPGNAVTMVQAATGDDPAFGHAALQLEGRIVSRKVLPELMGRTLQLAFWARGEGGHVVGRLGQTVDPAGADPSTSVEVVIAETTGVWTRYAALVVPNPMASAPYVRVELEGAGGATIDRVSLEVVEASSSASSQPPAVEVPKTSEPLRVELFPLQKKLNVLACGTDHLTAEAYAAASLVVSNANGREMLTQRVPRTCLAAGVAHFTVPFDAPHGVYHVRVKLLDRNGGAATKELSQAVTVPDMPWLGNLLGRERVVVPPFTPLAVRGHGVTCWGRKYDIAPTGLPTKITSAGGDVLAGPVELVLVDRAGAHRMAATAGRLAFSEKAEDRAVFSAHGVLPGLSVSVSASMEYDGMIRYELALSPRAGSTVRAGRLSLEIPLAGVTHVHGGLWSRSRGTVALRVEPALGEWRDSNVPTWQPGYVYPTGATDLPALYLPGGDGVVWNSLGVPSGGSYGPFQLPPMVGNFMPHLWAGSMNRGLSWFADNDRGWVHDETVPCFELLRTGEVTTLRVNVVAMPATIDKPFRVVFGLIATPVRPRTVAPSLAFPAVGTLGFGLPFARQLHGVEFGDLYLAKRFRDRLFAQGGYLTYKYAAGDLMPFNDPTWQALRSEWQMEPFVVDVNELHTMQWKLHGPDPRNYMSVRTCGRPSRWDYQLYHLDRQMAAGAVDGLYLDNNVANVCFNVQHADCGYLRPDGRVQGGYQLFATREAMKRAATLSYLHGKARPWIITHKTSHYCAPLISFADLVMDGEWGDEAKDFIDFWTQPYLEVHAGVDFGPNSAWLPKLSIAQQAEVRPSRTLLAALKLYDAWLLPTGMNLELKKRLEQIEKQFGVTEPGCRFVGYWQRDGASAVAGLPSGIKSSYYLRPGHGVLMYLSNLSKAPVRFAPAFEVRNWGLVLPARVTDAETGRALEGGELTIEGHDFRVVEVRSR